MLWQTNQPADIQFLFRADSIAQELNETLTLRLVATTPLPTGNSVFFRSDIDLVIVDSDGKN